MRSKRLAAILGAFAVLATAAFPQQFSKLADDTIAYVKAGTFGKPDVIKKTQKVALSQVRVHYKIATTSVASTRDNGARLTVYLDGDITDNDLQVLTDEFYKTLQQKLSALGIEFTDWSAIAASEYYADRVAANEEKTNLFADGSNGQAWVSFNANKGPVFYRYSVDQTKAFGNELLAYGKMKKLGKMIETVGGDFASIDVVLDFASIMLSTDKGTEWTDEGKFIRYGTNMSVGAMMNIPQSYVLLVNQKMGFDQYASKLPVAERSGFSEKPYQDNSKAALKTKALFGEPRFTYTPVVISARREQYLNAARRALALYADVLVEKLRLARTGTKPGNDVASQKPPVDTTTREQVNAQARANNETTPITTGELTAAAKQATEQRKFQLAVDYYTELIKLNPENAEYYLSRGALLLNELKNPKAAIKDFDKGYSLNPNEYGFIFNRGTAYLHTGDFKRSKQDMDAVIAKNPGFVSAYLNRGIALLNLKDYEKALADFESGIRIDPRMPNLYRARAIYYKIKGNAALAQADELRAAQLEGGR